MRRQTEHGIQLDKMYSFEDDRLKGEGKWGKFPFFWFQLFMSYYCTRTCEYCYSFSQNDDNTKMEMDDRTFSRLLEWIPEVWRANKVKVNYIGFLGGEPLLRTDRIKKVMDAVYGNTDGMQGALYTNGDLVDAVNWYDLEDIHWITTNIADTGIDELARRMKIVNDRSNVKGQTIVATMDDYNLSRLIEISRFGIENGYKLRYQKDIYRVKDLDYKERLLKQYHSLCDLLEDYITKGYSVHTPFLLDTLVSEWELDSSSPYPCGKNLAVVYPDGSVGPCIRDHSFTTGTIFDEDPMKILQCETFHYGFNKTGVSDECLVCESREVCQGGCPHDKLLMKGNVSGKSASCEVHKEIIPRLKQLDSAINSGKGVMLID
ncbi:MAG: SPASM domain-containing protein [Peptococcaceae bacterium]|nr:SPASM domain-containing protein [Peptococcaceae bacterium]